MSVSLTYYPNQKLREKSRPCLVTDLEEVVQLSQDMLELLYRENGIGLAAPQVGVPLRLIVVDLGPRPVNQTARVIMLNPIISFLQGEYDSEEGCLSIPGVKAPVKRANHIGVNFLDLAFQPQMMQAKGLFAAAIQHEVDHLEGITILDKVSRLKREILLKQGKYEKRMALIKQRREQGF